MMRDWRWYEMEDIISFRENEEGKKFPFLDVGSEIHGRKSFRLWVSGRLVREKEGQYYISFPVKGARIVRTTRGSLVLRPDPESDVHRIYVACGYRGSSTFEILQPEDAEIFRFKQYRSALGNLGISEGALLNVPKNTVVKYKWKKTGRLYGEPTEGITIVMPDGEERDFEDIPDGIEAIEEIKEEME